MNTLKGFIILIGLALSCSSVFSQGKGVVRFLVDVDNGYFEIEINDTMLLKRYKDTLPAGTYNAKVWSPGYVTNNITFTVVEGKTVEKYVEMAKTNDYLDYELNYKDYRNQFHKQFTAPLSLSLASTLVTGVFMVRAYTFKNKIQTDIDSYHLSSTTTEIDAIKLRIADNNKRYNRQRTLYYIGSGVSVLCIGGTIWSYLNFKKNYTEPVYFKESPFKDKYSFNITPYGCSLTLHI